MKIAVIAFDTRGGVQPYVALSLGLQRAGHEVTMITSEGFRDLVSGYGVTLAAITGDTEAAVRDLAGAAELSARATASCASRCARRSARPPWRCWTPLRCRSDHGRHRWVAHWPPGCREARRSVRRGTVATTRTTDRRLSGAAPAPGAALARRAGTTGATFRAGVPAVVVPFAVDQPFWGSRVAALGTGPNPIPRKRLTAENLSEALRVATTDAAMARQAAAIGTRIRAEDGVAAAADALEWISLERT